MYIRTIILALALLLPVLLALGAMDTIILAGVAVVGNVTVSTEIGADAVVGLHDE